MIASAMPSTAQMPEDVAAHDHGDWADDTVAIPQWGIPFEVEVVFHHLEEQLDIPPLAVDADDSAVLFFN